MERVTLRKACRRTDQPGTRHGTPTAQGKASAEAPEREHDPAVLRRVRREVEGGLYELIDEALSARAGFPM